MVNAFFTGGKDTHLVAFQTDVTNDIVSFQFKARAC